MAGIREHDFRRARDFRDHVVGRGEEVGVVGADQNERWYADRLSERITASSRCASMPRAAPAGPVASRCRLSAHLVAGAEGGEAAGVEIVGARARRARSGLARVILLEAGPRVEQHQRAVSVQRGGRGMRATCSRRARGRR